MINNYWNAGDAGCGSLAAGLKRYMDTIGPGEVLEVLARNEGAPADIPSWCRVTGHHLVDADHPVYVLMKKID
ncbi:MAG: sulfurtransferase TusA family protein [Woeseiaceae bacterium]|jgi:tRNA 2-thiouridine synthesizing protein A